MSDKKQKQEKKNFGPKELDEEFIKSVVDKKEESVYGISLRPPSLGTIAILTKLKNSLVTGSMADPDDLMMECLIFMYVHSAPMDEVHGAALLSHNGRSVALERKALEMAEKITFDGVENFTSLFDQLNSWITKHIENRVEPIPKDNAKDDSSPNE